MKRIEILEQMMIDKTFANAYKNYGCILRAYKDAKSNGNQLLNFEEFIWDDDIPYITEFCMTQNIKEFTISSSQSNLINTLEGFTRNGAVICGLVQTRSRYTTWGSEEYELVNAIKMRVL